jgi:hydrogenase maturation protease
MQSKIIVIGLGNPILGDDGVGWRIGELVQEKVRALYEKEPLGEKQVEVECVSEGGLRLMEIMIGCDLAIVVDALTTGCQPDGTISQFPLDMLPDACEGHIASPHTTTLQNALRMGRELGLHLPTQVLVVGIEARKTYDFSESLSLPVQASLPQAVESVMGLIEQYQTD